MSSFLPSPPSYPGPDAAWVSACPSSSGSIRVEVERLHREGRETLLIVHGIADGPVQITATATGVLVRLLVHALAQISPYTGEGLPWPEHEHQELLPVVVDGSAA